MKPKDRTKFNARHEVVGNVMQGLHGLSVKIDRPVSQSVQFNRLAVAPRRRASDEEEAQHPLAHMSLDKNGGSDEIGQLSAYVEGIELGAAPMKDRTSVG